MTTFRDNLQNLKQSDAPTAKSLKFLSDLGSEDRATLREVWPTLPLEQRRRITDALVNITDPWLKLAAAYALNGRNDKASEYFAKGIEADPKLGDDRQAQHRYHAARAAALASAGQGKDEPPQGVAATWGRSVSPRPSANVSQSRRCAIGCRIPRWSSPTICQQA